MSSVTALALHKLYSKYSYFSFFFSSRQKVASEQVVYLLHSTLSDEYGVRHAEAQISDE